jgi:hypothetical protein
VLVVLHAAQPTLGRVAPSLDNLSGQWGPAGSYT